MTSARTDRNTVQFGPSRTPQSYQLDRLEEQVKDVERATTEQFTTVNETIVNITGNAELLIGTVVTYSSVTSSGTVNIDGSVVNFTNASSVRLEADDVIILSANQDYPDPFAVGLVSRDGAGYDLFSFALPGLVAGLPVNLGTSWANRNQLSGAGLSKSLVVGDTIYTLADSAGDSIAYYDTGTPASGVLAAGGKAGSSSPWKSFSINGNVVAVFAGNGNNPFKHLAVHDGSTWTEYDYRFGNLEPNPQSGKIVGVFGQKNSTTTPVDGVFLVEIDSAGVLTETNLSALFTVGSGEVQLVAGGGHTVIAARATNELYVDGVVHPYAFNQPGKLFVVIQATSTRSDTGNAAWTILGDKLYFLARAFTDPMSFSTVHGAPLTVCVMDLTSPSLTTQVISNVFSSTGIYEDGEPMQVCSIAVPAANKVVVGGLWGWKYFEPTLAYGSGDYRAAYAVINTTTGAVSLIAPTYSSLTPGDYGQSPVPGATRNRLMYSCTVAAEPGSGNYYVFIYMAVDLAAGASWNLGPFQNLVDGGTV